MVQTFEKRIQSAENSNQPGTSCLSGTTDERRNFYGQMQELKKREKEGTTEVEQCKPQKEFEENILRADLHKHSVNVPSQVDNVQSQQLEEAEPKIELGMMVEFMIKEKLYYGCVKWLGTLDIKGKMIELLGLEMETYEIANNSGFFLGQKYFDCPEGKGFFAKTKICRVDRRSGDATSKQDNFNVDRGLAPRLDFKDDNTDKRKGKKGKEFKKHLVRFSISLTI
uniref:CAP-Gly domain-containing protein n=1 Tax=Clytia hemisphaerica TaxID=252671 RepID=A0A7M5VBW3_9CNID